MKICNYDFQPEKRMSFVYEKYRFNEKIICDNAFLKDGTIYYNGNNLISCFCALCLVRSLFLNDYYIKDTFSDFLDDYAHILNSFNFIIDEDFFNADNILKIDCLAYAYYVYMTKIGENIPVKIKNFDQVIIHSSLYL